MTNTHSHSFYKDSSIGIVGSDKEKKFDSTLVNKLASNGSSTIAEIKTYVKGKDDPLSTNYIYTKTEVIGDVRRTITAQISAGDIQNAVKDLQDGVSVDPLLKYQQIFQKKNGSNEAVLVSSANQTAAVNQNKSLTPEPSPTPKKVNPSQLTTEQKEQLDFVRKGGTHTNLDPTKIFGEEYYEKLKAGRYGEIIQNALKEGGNYVSMYPSGKKAANGMNIYNLVVCNQYNQELHPPMEVVSGRLNKQNSNQAERNKANSNTPLPNGDYEISFKDFTFKKYTDDPTKIEQLGTEGFLLIKGDNERKALGIHEDPSAFDTNVNNPEIGTAGCIGMRKEDARLFLRIVSGLNAPKIKVNI
jgi:hypothetical protein